MIELGSCGGKLSKEHVVSQSVLHVIADHGEVMVGGSPFTTGEELASIGVNSLVCKCLCQVHNSALHRLDTAAKSFFSDFRSCFSPGGDQNDYVVSGHDIERWLLKTLKALSLSNYLRMDGSALSGSFYTAIRILDLLDKIDAWPKGSGLYCANTVGDITKSYNRFQIAPMPNQDGDLCGLWANIIGVSFILLLVETQPFALPAGMLHRPGAIIVDHGGFTKTLTISWEDGTVHDKALSFRYAGEAPL